MKNPLSRNRLGSFALCLFAASCSSATSVVVPEAEDPASDGTGALDASRDARDSGQADAKPTFPYDTGRLVAALTSSSTANADLYIISTTGTAPVPLMQTPNRHELAPRWSPDHKKIAFLATAGRPGVSPWSRVDLLVVDADGSNERLLVNGVDGSLWPPTWSPDGRRISYLHGLASCAPPPDPDWHVADPCVDDLHAVRLSDGVDEDLVMMPVGDKFGVEPSWLSNGMISYFWVCRGEGCSGDGGAYRTSAIFSSERDSVYAGFGWERWFRQRAHKRDHLSWASVELPMYWSPSPASVAHAAAIRGQDQGPLVLCSALDRRNEEGHDATCSRLVDDPMAWSPRWNPEETRVAYQRTDGIWAIEVPVVPGRAPTQLFSATTEIAGFDW